MSKIKRFFKHRFVIVSMCLMLIGTLPLIIMALIPRANVYTNKSTVEYGYLDETVIYRLTIEDDKYYYIDYINKEGKVVKEKAVRGDYEIKDGVFYAAGSKWGKISVYGIDIKFGGFLDAGYECKPAKYARLGSIGFIAIGGLMFVLAAYVGLTKKKKRIDAKDVKSVNANHNTNQNEPIPHNPLARKLPRPIQRNVQQPSNNIGVNLNQSNNKQTVNNMPNVGYQPQVDNMSNTNNMTNPIYPAQVDNMQPVSNAQYQTKTNNMQTGNYINNDTNQSDVNNLHDMNNINTEIPQLSSSINVNNTYNDSNYNNSDYSVPVYNNQEETTILRENNAENDAYDDLVNAIEEEYINETINQVSDDYLEDSEQYILNEIQDDVDINQNMTNIIDEPQIISEEKVYFGEGIETDDKKDIEE